MKRSRLKESQLKVRNLHLLLKINKEQESNKRRKKKIKEILS
jgi:hypothetical protein